MPMATKLNQMGICNEKLPFVKPHGPLITRSCKIELNIGSANLYFHSPMATKLGRW